jgi:hypothetical protein
MTTVWEYYGEPEPFELQAATSKFFQTATRAHDRFGALPAYETHIKLIPLDEHGGKRPLSGFLPSRQAIPKTTEALALMASVCPDANVGVSSRRAVGAIIVVDCDEPGVLERIQRETDRSLPLTYTTQTRPRSASHKRHVIFMSTEYSCDRIHKQVTDVTHIAGYDLKGCGGFGYVAAEGCVRDDETIVALHDVPIVPIPDWLVDWLCADVAKARAMIRAMKVKKAKVPQPEPTSSRPFAVPRFRRTSFILSRIRTWKNTGLSDDQILPLVVDQVRECCEDGATMLTPLYIRKLRGMIRKVRTLGSRAAAANLLRDRRTRIRPVVAVRRIIETLPDQVTASEARRIFSVRDNPTKLRMIRQLRRHDYVCLGPQGSHERVWTRMGQHLSIPNPYASVVGSKDLNSYTETRRSSGSATTSESDTETQEAKKVACAEEVADGGLSITFQKDGTPEKLRNGTNIRATEAA